MRLSISPHSVVSRIERECIRIGETEERGTEAKNPFVGITYAELLGSSWKVGFGNGNRIEQARLHVLSP